jgi:WhiB family redox-sensing transcriptional regulator
MTQLTDLVADWRTKAACRGADPDTFFAEGRGSRADTEYARRVCAHCPVRPECGQYAIDTGQSWGVWGGMTQTELRRKRRRFTTGATA